MPLMTDSRFKDPDQAFVTLIEARRGLSEREASELDAKLVLILANHIGDMRCSARGDRVCETGNRRRMTVRTGAPSVLRLVLDIVEHSAHAHDRIA